MSIPSSETIHVLITGGSGFLGQHIIKAISSKHPQWKITVLDLNPPPSSILPLIHNHVSCDITSSSSVSDAFTSLSSTPSIVLHTAGYIPSGALRYSTSPTEWSKVKNINYHGTRNIVDATLTSGCQRLVYTSSCTIIQDDLLHDYPFADESTPTGYATLHYGRSKLLAENYVLDPIHREKYGLLACALRPCTLIGEGDTAVISTMHALIAQKSTNFVIGDGGNLYDFMVVGDCADAHVCAAENLLGVVSGYGDGDGSGEGDVPTAAGEVFFLSNDEPVYFWDLLLFLWACFGHVPSFRVYIPAYLAWVFGLIAEFVGWILGVEVALSTGSVRDSVRTGYADCSKARMVLGWKPRIGLNEGVRGWVEGYKRVLRQREEEQERKKNG